MSYIPRDFRKFLANSPRPVITGGGFGTTLTLHGCALESCSWSGAPNLTHPEKVREVQQQFADAHVQVLATNSFRTAEPFIVKVLEQAKLSAREFGEKIGLKLASNDPTELSRLATQHAVNVAIEARNASAKPLFVAGSYGPLSDTHAEDRRGDPSFKETLAAHYKHASLLKSLGVDILCAETIPTGREALAMIKAAEATGLQTVVSFALNPRTGNLFDGTTIENAVRLTESKNRVAVMFNCTPVNTVDRAIDRLLKVYNGFIGAYPNTHNDHSHPHENGIDWVHDHSEIGIHKFAHTVASWQEKAPDQIKLLGGCCGATPEHMKATAKTVADRSTGRAPQELVASAARRQAPHADIRPGF